MTENEIKPYLDHLENGYAEIGRLKVANDFNDDDDLNSQLLRKFLPIEHVKILDAVEWLVDKYIIHIIPSVKLDYVLYLIFIRDKDDISKIERVINSLTSDYSIECVVMNRHDINYDKDIRTEQDVNKEYKIIDNVLDLINNNQLKTIKLQKRKNG